MAVNFGATTLVLNARSLVLDLLGRMKEVTLVLNARSLVLDLLGRMKEVKQSEWQFFVVLLLLLAGLNAVFAFTSPGGKGRNKAIPAVRGGWPFFGQVFDMIKGSPWDTMDKWVAEYGPIYKFHLFGSAAICVSDPVLLEVVLNHKQSIFRKDLEWTYAPFMVILGNGLVTAHGESWRKQRFLLAHHLRNDILDEIPQMGLEAVQRLCVKLEEAKQKGTVLEMAEEFRHLTLQVIAEALLSLSPEESDSTFAKMYLPIVEEGNLRTWSPERAYMPTPAWFAFRAAVKRLNDYVSSLIEKRWALRLREQEQEKKQGGAGAVAGRKQDVLDKILSAVPAEDWGPAAVQQIRDEIKTFVLAGHETSASMLAWSLYELSIDENKALLEKVLAEGRAVYSPSAHCDANGHVTSLPPRSRLSEGLAFTEMCLRESLRKYSIVPTVVRKAAADVELGEYKLKRGDTVMINVQGVHHTPSIWPEPFVYRPSRFEVQPQPYTFLPFVDGPRSCLGQFLSLLESKVVLSTLLKRYRFELTNPLDAGNKHSFMVPIIPQTGHYFKVHGRENK